MAQALTEADIHCDRALVDVRGELDILPCLVPDGERVLGCERRRATDLHTNKQTKNKQSLNKQTQKSTSQQRAGYDCTSCAQCERSFQASASARKLELKESDDDKGGSRHLLGEELLRQRPHTRLEHPVQHGAEAQVV